MAAAWAGPAQQRLGAPGIDLDVERTRHHAGGVVGITRFPALSAAGVLDQAFARIGDSRLREQIKPALPSEAGANLLLK